MIESLYATCDGLFVASHAFRRHRLESSHGGTSGLVWILRFKVVIEHIKSAGHASDEMMEHYSHVRKEAKRKALDALARRSENFGRSPSSATNRG